MSLDLSGNAFWSLPVLGSAPNLTYLSLEDCCLLRNVAEAVKLTAEAPNLRTLVLDIPIALHARVEAELESKLPHLCIE